MAIRQFRPSKGPPGENQDRQQCQYGQQCHQHGQSGKDTEINGRYEIGQHQYGKTEYNGYGGVENGLAHTLVTYLKGSGVIAVAMVLLSESVNIVDAVVDGNPHGDGGNRDSHHVQGDIQQSHKAQNQGDRQKIGNDADQGEFNGFEKYEQHNPDAGQYQAQGQDLGPKKTLEHVVVEDKHPGYLRLLFRKP